MSVHVFFMFSTGLKSPITVPRGTLKRCQEHVAHVETTLGFERTKYLHNPEHWKSTTPQEGVPDDVFCATAREHNAWVRWLYEDLAKWMKETPSGEIETLTPDDAQTFWAGLQMIDVPAERWTDGHYRDRMEHLYEVMRGRPSEGVIFDARKLTEQQAASVIRLFEAFLDPGDARLEVPKGHDRLASTDEYVWCEKCGAVDPYDVDACRKRKCPVREDGDG